MVKRVPRRLERPCLLVPPKEEVSHLKVGELIQGERTKMPGGRFVLPTDGMEPPGLVGSVWGFNNVDSSRKCSSYYYAYRFNSCWDVPEYLGWPPKPVRSQGLGILLPGSLLNPGPPSPSESSTQAMSVTLRVDLDSHGIKFSSYSNTGPNTPLL